MIKHPNNMYQFIPISKLYQEHDSNFESNNAIYNLNYIFKAVEKQPVEYIDITELVWILKHVDKLDPVRVNNSDVTKPILVVKYRNKELVIDGLHRLSKALNSRMKKLPYKRVTKEIFEASKVRSQLIPTYKNW